jgi:hypothetical protein
VELHAGISTIAESSSATGDGSPEPFRQHAVRAATARPVLWWIISDFGRQRKKSG